MMPSIDGFDFAVTVKCHVLGYLQCCQSYANIQAQNFLEASTVPIPLSWPTAFHGISGNPHLGIEILNNAAYPLR